MSYYIVKSTALSVPSRFVRMVTMQPFIQIDSSQEPYRWEPAAKKSQLDAIVRTLDVACDQSQGPPAKLTIFLNIPCQGLMP